MWPELSERQAGALWRWGARLSAAMVVVCVLSYLPYRLVTASGERKLTAMTRELDKTQREIRSLAEDNRKRRRRVEALKSDTGAIENFAREELQMVYPHEMTLRLPRGGER